MFSAMVMVPIMLAMGTALDYLQASNMRTSIAALADAATLAGVSERSIARTVGSEQTREQVSQITKDFFATQLNNNPKLKPLVTSFSVSMSTQNKVVTVQLCFSAEAKVFMMALSGRKTMPLSGCSHAAMKMPEYVSVHAIVDASGSMGIGATLADQLLMEKRLGCAFACHAGDAGQPLYAPQCNTFNQWSQTPNCAKMIGARTRFDIARESLLTIVDQANALTRWPNQFTFSVHKFSGKPTEVHAASTNLSSVRTAIQAMTLDPTGTETNLRLSLSQILPKIPASGDGSSPLSPKVYVVLVSDGIESVSNYSCSVKSSMPPCSLWQGSTLPAFIMGEVRKQVMTPASCAPFKEKGITFLMLYTEYSIPPNNGTNEYFAQIASQFLPEMKGLIQACASKPDLAFYASSPGQIQAASDRLFREIAMKPELVR